MKKLLKSQKGRLLVALIALAAVIGVNCLASVRPLRLDITQNHAMTPAEEALQLVRGIDKPVSITLIASEDDRDVWVYELLSRYAAANGMISFAMVDPASPRLETLNARAGQTLSSGSVLVESEARSVTLSSSDLYAYTYNQMAYYYSGALVYDSADFIAQNAVCNALYYVTRSDMPVLYVLTGHGEASLDSTLATLCFKNSIALETLDLPSCDAVPADAAAVLLCSPSQALSEADTAKLLTYLKDGGDMLLMTDYGTAMDGLDVICEYYGMAQLPGVVLDEDSSYVYSTSYKHYLKPELVAGELTSSLIENRQSVVLPLASALTRSSVRRAGLNAEVLMRSSDSSYRKPDTSALTTLDREPDDPNGPFVLAMSATEGDTRLIWLGSGTMCSATGDGTSSGGNSAFLTCALQSMFDFPDGLSIEGTSLLTDPLSAPALPALCALAALPLAFLIVGLIRRRKAA